MAGTLLTEFDPTKLQYGTSGGTLSNGMKAVGISGAQVGEGGVTGNTGAVGYSAFDPAHQGVGDKMTDYDASGKYAGTHEITPENGTAKDLAQGIATIVAAYFGATAAFGGLGGAAAGAAEGGAAAGGSGLDASWATGFTDTGTAGGALDTGYAGSGALTGATGETTFLTDGASGVGDFGPGPEGYDPSTMPTEADVNASDAVPDSTSPDYRNGSDINSDIATETGTAPPGSVNEGVTTNSPGAYITPTPSGPFDWLKDFISPGTGGVASPITTALQTAGLVGTLLTPKPTGTTAQTPKPAETPPQPLVGAGTFTSANAQGGASGSLQGVAGTLLTSKDTFGYGRTMLH